MPWSCQVGGTRLLQGCQWGIFCDVHFYFHFTFPLSKWSEKIHVLEVSVHPVNCAQLKPNGALTEKGLVEENAVGSSVIWHGSFRSEFFHRPFTFSFPFLGLMYLRMIFLGSLWLTDFLLSYFSPVTGNAEFIQYLGWWDSFAENEMGLRYLMEVKCKSLVITKLLWIKCIVQKMCY